MPALPLDDPLSVEFLSRIKVGRIVTIVGEAGTVGVCPSKEGAGVGSSTIVASVGLSASLSDFGDLPDFLPFFFDFFTLPALPFDFVGADVTGNMVVGKTVVGKAVVGCSVVSCVVPGDRETGLPDDGMGKAGGSVTGSRGVGAIVVGRSVVGRSVVGVPVGNGLEEW
jgi:hypothetical protein